jgi:hypothetical protein
MGGHPSILLVVVQGCVTATTRCVRRCGDLRNLCGASLRGAKAPRPAPRPPGAPPPPRPAPRPPGAPPPPRPAPRPPGGVRAPCPTSRPAGDPRLPRPVRTLQALSLLRVQLCVLQALSQNRSGGMPQPRPNSDGGHYNIWERPNSMPSCHCGPFAASGAIGTPAPQATCARSAWPRAPSVRRTHGARDVLSHLSSLQRIARTCHSKTSSGVSTMHAALNK